MSELQQFGGDWTIEKLDILTSYLDAYLTALKKQRFEKIYVDAFAGTGSITTRDGSRQVAGSAKLALLARNNFDRYYFIEKDKHKAAELDAMVKKEFPDLARRVCIKCGDANTELQGICNSINWNNSRALLSLDPYATQVSWTTLERVAHTGSFDVWYLFPFSALVRMLRRDGKLEQSWIDCINRLLGDSGWANEFYEEDPQINLFETDPIIKTATAEDIQAYIIKRLKTIFPAVARNPRVFYNECNAPLFLFCFAVSSNSGAAQKLALKIAEHILQFKR